MWNDAAAAISAADMSTSAPATAGCCLALFVAAPTPSMIVPSLGPLIAVPEALSAAAAAAAAAAVECWLETSWW
jgi:hypothetical protein